MFYSKITMRRLIGESDEELEHYVHNLLYAHLIDDVSLFNSLKVLNV